MRENTRSMFNIFPMVLREIMDSLKLWLLPLLCLFKRTVPAEVWPAEKPLVSVIIPCYNHGHYLSEAVDSVLAQTLQSLEIIVVNDGSDDGTTVSILEKFSRPKTRILSHAINLGLPAARNTGIRQAQGKFICCLDADDKIHPTYLEKALLLMESNIAIGFVYPWTQVFGKEQRVWYTPQFDASELIYHNQLNSPGVFRRAAWEIAGGYREEMRLGYEDWEFWIRLARYGHHGYRIPEKLIFVRRMGRSFVHAAMERHEQLTNDIRRYNPDVYEDLGWLKKVKQSTSEILVKKPFDHLSINRAIKPYNKPLLWINKSVSARFRGQLPALIQKIQTHKGDFIFISFKWLDEDITDILYAQTQHVYILPNFLPPCAWKQFVKFKKLNVQTGEVEWHESDQT